jgi:hypothetical protein
MPGLLHGRWKPTAADQSPNDKIALATKVTFEKAPKMSPIAFSVSARDASPSGGRDADVACRAAAPSPGCARPSLRSRFRSNVRTAVEARDGFGAFADSDGEPTAVEWSVVLVVATLVVATLAVAAVAAVVIG